MDEYKAILLRNVRGSAQQFFDIDFDALGVEEGTRQFFDRSKKIKQVAWCADACMLLDDQDLWKQFADFAGDRGSLHYSMVAHLHLDDSTAIRRVLGAAANTSEASHILNTALDGKENSFIPLHNNYMAWIYSHGLTPKSGIGFSSFPSQVFMDASVLAGDYDLGVVVAYGGLSGGYALEVMGLPVKVIEAKRKGKGASFDWRNVDPRVIEGKDVLVVENDVMTGRTLRRVARELGRANPKSIDLYFTLREGYNDERNIPDDFRNVRHYGLGERGDCLEVYEKITERLKIKD